VKILLKLSIATALFVGLPLLGAAAVPATWGEVFEFPPVTRYIDPAPFSWVAFALIAAFTAAWVAPFLLRALGAGRQTDEGPPADPEEAAGNVSGHAAPRPARRRFPWWGWAALAQGVVGWGLAWTRFGWFAPLQRMTYPLVWFPYILVINALAFRRSGRCLLADRPRFFLALFPLSSLFWWFFEYLNRFVQNWHYVEDHADRLTHPLVGPWGYAAFATVAFSTVLPAVLSTQQLLGTFQVFDRFRNWVVVRHRRPRALAWTTLAVIGSGLALIGVLPDLLFPLLWVSPLLVLVSLQQLWGDRHVLDSLPAGNWRPIVTAAVAALVCGVFWETWNDHSLMKWVYAVPFVQRFLVFEMPLLGFAGYLPFGLECAAVGQLLGGSPLVDVAQERYTENQTADHRGPGDDTSPPRHIAE
jgi:hypothetical protein